MGCAAPPPARTGERGGAPQRVVSLNLCTDELLLLLADRGQITSTTHLSRHEAETPLWQHAAAYPANDGTLAAAAAMRPDLVLTMGGGGDRLRIAERMNVPLVDLPYPQTIEDVVTAIQTVAAALRQESRGEALAAKIEALRRSAPAAPADTIWIGGGGRTVAAQGLQAEWMVLAGYRQRQLDGDQVQLETLLAEPPQVLLRSDYRQGQYSRGQAWLNHPLSRERRGSRTVQADGRRWTCLGPLMIDEVERLRRELPR